MLLYNFEWQDFQLVMQDNFKRKNRTRCLRFFPIVVGFFFYWNNADILSDQDIERNCKDGTGLMSIDKTNRQVKHFMGSVLI